MAAETQYVLVQEQFLAPMKAGIVAAMGDAVKIVTIPSNVEFLHGSSAAAAGGCGGEEEERRQAFAKAEIAILAAELVAPEALRAAIAPPRRWVYSVSASVTALEGLDFSATVTNARGIYSVPVAEMAVCGMLMVAKRQRLFQRQQVEKKWQKLSTPVLEVQGMTVGIVGLGSIGQEVASEKVGTGAQLLATDGWVTESDLVEELWKPDRLGELLAQSDFLVLCAPLTAGTKAMIGKAELAQMKKGAILVNVARGPLVDEKELASALASGHLGGAYLDVVETEPMPESSELWEMDNVVITPHTAFLTPAIWGRHHALLKRNYELFRAGKPLENTVELPRA